MVLDREFKFKSYSHIFEKERANIKNNTVRKIDLNDDRFLDLIAWAVEGFNDDEIQIIIQRGDNEKDFFIREIRDITIYNDLMIITWNENKKLVSKLER